MACEAKAGAMVGTDVAVAELRPEPVAADGLRPEARQPRNAGCVAELAWPGWAGPACLASLQNWSSFIPPTQGACKI